MHKYSIYKLINPIDNSIFYVGITSKELNFRLLNHINESLCKKKTEKHILICQITEVGKKPVIEEIESHNCEISKALKREKYWISFYKNAGCPLTNIAATTGRVEVPLSHDPIVARTVYTEVKKYIKEKNDLLDLEETAISKYSFLDASFPEKAHYDKRSVEILAQRIILEEVKIRIQQTFGSFIFKQRDPKTGDFYKNYKQIAKSIGKSA